MKPTLSLSLACMANSHIQCDQDGDRKLNKIENARYLADKEGIDPEQAAYYAERGCTYDKLSRSYYC